MRSQRHFAVALMLLLCQYTVFQGQTCSCTQQPTILGAYSFPPGTTVYYTLDASLGTIPLSASGGNSPTDQIVSALNAWSKANVTSGGDGIIFVPADPQHAATLTIAADTSTAPSAATTTQEDPTSGILGPTNHGTITFHPFGLLSGTTTRGLDETAPGYDTVYLQAALHEIGHVQGIGDYLPASSAPPPGVCASVMLPIRGINDSGNISPTIPAKTDPSDCDKATAATDSKLAGVPPPQADGGGAATEPAPLLQFGPQTAWESFSFSPSESGKGTIIDWYPID